jgi:lipocalin-like protein
MSLENNANLIGAWTLISWVHEDIETRERRPVFGEHPRGCFVFTESGRAVAVLTGEGRRSPTTENEKAEAFGSMVAYSGRYRIEDNKLTTTVDIAWDESLVGSNQVRFFRIDGDRLEIETAPFVSPRFGGNVVRSFLSWQKENDRTP